MINLAPQFVRRATASQASPCRVPLTARSPQPAAPVVRQRLAAHHLRGMYKSMLIPSELCVPAGMLGLTAPWFGMCTESGDVWFLLHEPQTIIHTTKFSCDEWTLEHAHHVLLKYANTRLPITCTRRYERSRIHFCRRLLARFAIVASAGIGPIRSRECRGSHAAVDGHDITTFGGGICFHAQRSSCPPAAAWSQRSIIPTRGVACDAREL